MMMEELGIFSNAQSIGFNNGGTGSALILSTNKIDLLQRRDLDFDGLYVEFRVTTAFTVGTGSPTLQFGIVTGDASDLSGNSTVQSLCGGLVPALGIGAEFVSTPVLVSAQLTAGLALYMPMPRTSLLVSALSGYTGGVRNSLQRYLGVGFFQPSWALNYFATGSMSARLVMHPTKVHFGPDPI